MGFPPELMTCLFAIPRVAGWLAHWRESLDDPDSRILRPQQDYRGEWLRHYAPLNGPDGAGRPAAANGPTPLEASNAFKRRMAGTW